ncbi:MAG: ChbG/HpnK family deacetylase [Alphaproteobacteria bacterium]|nr:ChbG/HpnK family deacetylase [Alphaproteobacteria bacterium]
MTKVIFNADDFGISPGVNQAIFKAHAEGILNSTSLMVNQQFADEAVKMAQKMPNLSVGLHINLTNETPAANSDDIPLLVGADGKFKNGFVKLLILSFLHPKKLQSEAYLEVKAQIEKYLKTGLKLEHLDGHRHVHMIPAIFKAVKQLQTEYNVPRIRVMNENLLNTIRQNRGCSYLFDGGLIKYFLLRFLSLINRHTEKTYFYTILYTCKLSKAQFQNVKIPAGYDAVEIMIHPGMPEIDTGKDYLWDENILSPYRTQELELLLDKEILKGIR